MTDNGSPTPQPTPCPSAPSSVASRALSDVSKLRRSHPAASKSDESVPDVRQNLAVYLDNESTSGDNNARVEDAPADAADAADAATAAAASGFKFEFAGIVRRAGQREESTEEHTDGGNKNNTLLQC